MSKITKAQLQEQLDEKEREIGRLSALLAKMLRDKDRDPLRHAHVWRATADVGSPICVGVAEPWSLMLFEGEGGISGGIVANEADTEHVFGYIPGDVVMHEIAYVRRRAGWGRS